MVPLPGTCGAWTGLDGQGRWIFAPSITRRCRGGGRRVPDRRASSPPEGERPARGSSNGRTVPILIRVDWSRGRHGLTARLTPSASPYDAQAALEHLLGRLRARRRRHPRLGLGARGHDGDGPSYRQAVADQRRRRRTPPAAPRSSSAGRLPVGGHPQPRPLVARADGRRAADRELAERGIRSAHAEPLIRGRRGRRRPHRRAGRCRRSPPAPAGRPQLAVATAEAWARRSEARRSGAGRGARRPDRVASKAQSMDHLLGPPAASSPSSARSSGRASSCSRTARLVPRMASYADGRRDPATWEQFRNAPVGLQLAETVLRTGEPITADRDSGLLSGWWVDSFHIASVSPSRWAARPDLAGVLTLDSTAVRPFSEDVRRLAAAAGAHLGGVIEQARTSQARAASLTTARVVRQMLVDGAGATGVAEAAEVLARAVQRLAGTDRSAAYLLGEDGRSARSATSTGPTPTSRSSRTGSSAARRRRPAVATDRGAEAPGVRRGRRDQRSPRSPPDAGPRPRLLRQRALLSGDRLLGLVVTGSVSGARTWPASSARPSGRSPSRGRSSSRTPRCAPSRSSPRAAGHRGPSRPADRPGQPPPVHRGARGTVYAPRRPTAPS